MIRKTVPHATALAHHVADKHTAGNHLSIKPDWAVNGTIYLDGNDNDDQTLNITNDCIHCDVCMWNFSSESDYRLHLDHLKPISSVMTQKNETCAVLKCEHCGRQFKQHRSLKQHFNMCSAAAAAATTKVIKVKKSDAFD